MASPDIDYWIHWDRPDKDLWNFVSGNRLYIRTKNHSQIFPCIPNKVQSIINLLIFVEKTFLSKTTYPTYISLSTQETNFVEKTPGSVSCSCLSVWLIFPSTNFIMCTLRFIYLFCVCMCDHIFFGVTLDILDRTVLKMTFLICCSTLLKPLSLSF